MAGERVIDRTQASPGDIIEWRCDKCPTNIHRWRIVGVHLAAIGTESLLEMESLTHGAGWTGEREFHPRVFVPEVLLREPSVRFYRELI